MSKDATWTNGKRTVRGRWAYFYGPQRFAIELYERDRTTGLPTKQFRVAGDEPEWGKWKLVQDEPRVALQQDAETTQAGEGR